MFATDKARLIKSDSVCHADNCNLFATGKARLIKSDFVRHADTKVKLSYSFQDPLEHIIRDVDRLCETGRDHYQHTY